MTDWKQLKMSKSILSQYRLAKQTAQHVDDLEGFEEYEIPKNQMRKFKGSIYDETDIQNRDSDYDNVAYFDSLWDGRSDQSSLE